MSLQIIYHYLPAMYLGQFNIQKQLAMLTGSILACKNFKMHPHFWPWTFHLVKRKTAIDFDNFSWLSKTMKKFY